MKVKRLSKSLFFVSAFFLAHFSLGSQTLIVETPTHQGSKIGREGRHIYVRERRTTFARRLY